MAVENVTVPPAGGDWRARMAVRGGRLTHAVAGSGFSVFGFLGAAVGMLFTLIYVLTGDGYDPSAGGRLVGGALLFVPMGFVLVGLLAGLPAQYAARSWLRTPSAAERRAAREAAEQAPTPEPDRVRPGGSWGEAYEGCAGSVTAFHAVERTLDDGPARDWFTEMGATLDHELAAALRLAGLGESLEAAGSEDAAGAVAERLQEARTALAGTVELATSTALDLRSHADLTDVRAQLDMLSQQAPNLRSDP